MNVSYFLKNKTNEKSAVFAAVRFRGRLYRFYPGVTVLTEFWDPGEQRAQAKKHYKDEANIINIQLDRYEGHVKKAFEPYILNQTAPPLEQIKKEITALKNDQEQTTEGNKPLFVQFFKDYYENAPYKRQTWKKYNTTYNWLTRYEKQFNVKLTFESVNVAFYENFKTWILNQKYKPKKDQPPRNYSLNYFGSLVKCIKVVMNEAGPYGVLKLHKQTEFKNKKFKVDSETADAVYLSTDELELMHKFTATPENVKELTQDHRPHNLEKKAAALNLAKNKFLVGSYTALRVSDFNRLEEVNISTGFITIRPAKGTAKNENVVIPIHRVIREILQTGFNLATPVTEQKINKHIKEVARLVGINEPITTARTEGRRVVDRTRPKYELISNHTARRSGATNMYLAGIPAISIMKITNHRTQASFMKYIKVSQEENARLLQNHPFFK